MPILRVTVTENRPSLHGASVSLRAALRSGLAADPGPVTVMLHGYKYQPGHPVHCPHTSLFARKPERRNAKIVSWPHHLGLRAQHGEGLGLAFGWAARGSIWDAYKTAEHAGQALACLLSDIRQMAPERPIHLVGHSLGARVALCAVRDSAPGTVTRAILLAAAVYGGTARDALCSDAGRQTDVLNVTSRENDIYDYLMERLVPPDTAGDRMLGHGGHNIPNMVTLQLDDGESLQRLSHAGFPIAAPSRRICHWSPYLRRGVFALYRAYLSGALSAHSLRGLLPTAPAPRWSRLRPRLPRRPAYGMAAEYRG